VSLRLYRKEGAHEKKVYGKQSLSNSRSSLVETSWGINNPWIVKIDSVDEYEGNPDLQGKHTEQLT